MHMALGNKIIRKNIFVVRAIHRLCDNGNASHGIHVIYSDLAGALHLYYGDKETPFQIIWSLIKKGTILAEQVDGGLRIYDPKATVAAENPRLFVPAEFRIVKLNQMGFAHVDEVEKAVITRLSKVFDYTEAALLCGGMMELSANRKMKAGKDTKVLDFSWNKDDNKIYITVYLGVKRGKIEFMLSVPYVEDCEKIAVACKKALHFSNGRAKQEPYKLKDQYRSNAQKVVEIVTSEKGKLNFDVTDAQNVIVKYANEFDKNNCIPEERFKEILCDQVSADPNRGVMATLVRIFTTGEAPLLTRTTKADVKKYHCDGYILTKHASTLITGANGDADEGSLIDIHQKLLALLHKKRAVEKELAGLDKQINTVVYNIDKYELQIKDLTNMLESASVTLAAHKDAKIELQRLLKVFDESIYTIADVK